MFRNKDSPAAPSRLRRSGAQSSKYVGLEESGVPVDIDADSSTAVEVTEQQSFPSSPARTAASSYTSSPRAERKKKSSTVMRRLKNRRKKPSPSATTERITVGDEYAIVSVTPKVRFEETRSLPKSSAEEKRVDNAPQELKKQRISLVKMFSGRGKKKTTLSSKEMTRSMSTPDNVEEQELKTKKFSLVRGLSRRRNDKPSQSFPSDAESVCERVDIDGGHAVISVSSKL